MEKKSAGTPADVERLNKTIDEALALSKKMAPLDPANKWSLDGTKEGVTVHSTYDPAGLAMSRGEGVIDVPMYDLAEYLFDDKHLGDYDTSLETNECLAHIDERTAVCWELTKKITFVSQRDFLYCCRGMEIDGSIYIIAKSIDWPGKPVASGHVRAELKLVAWILTPVKDKPNSTHTVHIVSVDLKGSIPSAIVSRETLKQGYVTIKIRETIAAWLKKRGPRKAEEKSPFETKKAVEEKKPVEETKPVEEKKPEETKPVEEKKPEETKPEEKKPEEKPEEKKPEETKPEEKKAEPVAETKKEECCDEKKKDECCTEEKKESTEKKECCDADKKECCEGEKKECCDKKEDKECCDKGKECTEKKECCEATGECNEKKEAAEEPKKE